MIPKISVITSVYNTKTEYLEDYIESIMGQTYQEFEVIIVDDGSKNFDTVEFLKDIQKKYSNKVSVIFQKNNQGISASRNLALQRARGEYICVIDSDDYYDKNFLKQMIEPIEKDHNIDMVVCSGYTAVNERKERIGVVPGRIRKRDIFFYFRMPTGTRLIKRKILTDSGINFPVGMIYEDNTFCIAATLHAARLASVDCYGYMNRISQKSYSHGDLYKKITEKKIPYLYMKRYILNADQMGKVNKNKRTAAQGAVLNMLATSACFFCRESEKEEIDILIKKSSKFIHKYMKHYVKYMCAWCMHCPYNFMEKLLDMGYCIAVCMRCENVYVKIVHSLLRFIDSRKMAS